MIGSDNAKALVSFYERVFGKKADMGGEDFGMWKVGDTSFSIGPHSEISGKAAEPQRIILNFETDKVALEFERIKALGAQVVKEPYEMEGWEGSLIATFADPDGNYFQLMSPWKE